MDKDFKPVKSVYNSNQEVIQNIMKLYNIEQFDLDCTYSKGTFWKNLPQPKIKSDFAPVNDTVIQANSENLPFGDNSMSSIMYDPPFIISGKLYKENKEGSSIIAKRFEGYTSYDKLTKNYYNTLKELYRVCSDKGYVVVKSQDTVSGGKNYFTHNMIMNMALEIGFYPKDLFILVAKARINSFGGKWNKQEHARKHHSYFIVLQKTKPRVNYEFLKFKQESIDNDSLPRLDKLCAELSNKIDGEITYVLDDFDIMLVNGKHFRLYYNGIPTRVMVSPEIINDELIEQYDDLIGVIMEQITIHNG